MKKNIVVFASGSGSNFLKLAKACNEGEINGNISLLVASQKEIGATQKAKELGIDVLIEKEMPLSELKAKLATLKINLICLAGYMKKIDESLLSLCPIMNIHPALLPSFGGKGMFGKNVHKAVLDSGAKLTGVSVHFIDADYDKGIMIAQKTVPVLEDDTIEGLSERVLKIEHFLYPLCVKLFCEDKIKIEGNKARILKEKLEKGKIKRALLSVSDKTGLENFAKGLHHLGVELVSTSGTLKFLKSLGLPVRDISSLTCFPEILGGRVKTLHPNVHGGILFKRDDKDHSQTVEELGIEPIDLLVVNLYPFKETALKVREGFADELIENIDIGGPSMLRSAAKNFKDVTVVCNTCDYESVLKEIQATNGTLSYETRQRLCIEAFTHTGSYDATISEEFKKRSGQKFSQTKILVLNKIQDLRYGENPYQSSALYTQEKKFSFEKLHGKELSYNNILDAFGTWDAVHEFEAPACVIFKHVTPCGIGTGKDLKEALERAWNCDPKSAFGGIISFNRTLTTELANFVSQFFVEAISAPDYEEKALSILRQKKNLRILKRSLPQSSTMLLRSVGDEVLLQDPDLKLYDKDLACPTKRKPTKEEERALKFAFSCVKHIKSNAIVLTNENASLGIGAGQMSRVDAVKMSQMKYQEYLETHSPSPLLVLGSDAFFPFRDGVDLAKSIGVCAIISPGGSVRDEEVIQACNEHNIAMLFTGIRHFRH